jgi:hypothetical protein
LEEINMVIRLIDGKRNEMLNIKIDLNDKMFIVVPTITNNKFEYMRQRLMNVRKNNMDIYLKEPMNYEMVELKLVKEMKKLLEQEIKHIQETLGINYYIA